MFLNNRDRAASQSRHEKGTLRGKIERSVVAVLMLVLSLALVVMLICQRHAVYGQAGEKLNVFVNEFYYEYLVGKEYLHSIGRPVYYRKLPENVRNFIESREDFTLAVSYVTAENTYLAYGVCGDAPVEYTFKGPDFRDVERTDLPKASGVEFLREQFNDEAYGEDINQIYFLLFDSHGNLLAKSGFAYMNPDFFRSRLPDDGLPKKVRLSYDPTAVIAADGSRLQSRSRSPSFLSKLKNVLFEDGVLVRYNPLYDGNILVIGEDMSRYNRYLYNLLLTCTAMLAAALILTGIFARVIANRFVEGIKRVASTARTIGAGNFSKRVEHLSEGTEIDDLVDSFNDMAENTENVLGELRSLSVNIAHNLKTPITRLRAKAELAAADEGVSVLAGDVAEECSGMMAMINTLLSITRTEFRMDNREFVDLDVAAVASDACDMFSTLAEDKQIWLKCIIPEVPVIFRGDMTDFQTLFGNLIDNAIKFTKEGGWVTVSVADDNGSVKIDVEDNGPGIPVDERKFVFGKFYRCRNVRGEPGSGLGLSLVKAIIERYSGTVSVADSRNSAHGTWFRVVLNSVLH